MIRRRRKRDDTKSLQRVLGTAADGRTGRNVVGRRASVGVVSAGTFLLRLGVADARIQRGNVEQEEPEELLNPWQEAGSRGLATPVEAMTTYR